MTFLPLNTFLDKYFDFSCQREQKEKAQEERQVKSKLRERRLASARARRYYDDYQLRMRARMLKRRTKEEKVFGFLTVYPTSCSGASALT